MKTSNTRLAVDICGISLKNPVMPASGCFGFGREYGKYYDLSKLGAIIVKATTATRRTGNPTPRVAEVRGGMLNSIGLANPGLDYVLQHELPWLQQFDIPVIVNVAGDTVPDYVQVVDAISRSKLAAAVELNVSCPNVKAGGLGFGVDRDVLGNLVRSVKKVCSIPLIVKLSPNVTSITDLAEAAVAAGADGLSLINTLLGMKIDVRSRKPVLARGSGGLSGISIMPVAVRMVYETARVVSVPIIGMGGVTSGEDAIEFIMAGASAVAVGTANFTDPFACPRIVEEIDAFLVQQGVNSVEEIRGCAHD